MKKVCIFCKSSENLGLAVEHIFPESIGNTQKILPSETVCLKCNNGFLSKLDQAFIEFEPIAMIKAFLQVPSKKGKIKSLHLGDTKINNNKKGHIGIEIQHGSQFEHSKDSSGWENLKLHSTGKKILTKSEYKLVARALLKQAYECMFLDFGHNHVLSQKYDSLRESVVSGKNFEGRLLIRNSVKINHTQCRFQYQFIEKGGISYLLVLGNYFGLEMATIFPECKEGLNQVEKLSIIQFSKFD